MERSFFLNRFVNTGRMTLCLAMTFRTEDAYSVSGMFAYFVSEMQQFSNFAVDPPVELGTGAPLIVTSEKMSKSRHNGIDPQVMAHHRSNVITV